MSFFTRFFALFRRDKLDADMAEEMRAHIELQAERNRVAGMSEEDALAAARKRFGGVAQIQERARDGLRFMWIENLIRDAGFAVRTLRKSPGFTSVVVLTLALGLGVNTALFGWFNAAVFRPLPVPQPEQLVAIKRLDKNGAETSAMSYTDFVAYRDYQTVFSGLAASDGLNAELLNEAEVNATTGEEATALRLEAVSPSYFSVFDVPMALGRPLVAADESPSGALPVIVLSHHFWQNRFGGDPAVVGRTLRMRGLTEESLTIVGVTGPGFYGTKPGALAGWVPLLLRSGNAWRTDLGATHFTLTGRLLPGVPRAQAADALQVIANQFLMRPHTGAIASETIILARASAYLNLTAQDLEVVLPMICVFGAVLLIACANASNLMLARTVTRQFEFAVRSALGATRRRLFTLLMTESLVLGVLGGVVGWLVAAGLLQFVWPWLIGMIPGAREGTAGLQLHADHRVFLFTLTVSMLAGAIGGLWPALSVSRRNVASALSREGSAFGRRVRLSRVRSVLAVGQLALSSALVFTAGLLVHKALDTQFADVGFDRSRLLTLEVVTPRSYEPDQIDSARRQVLERVRAIPDVETICETPRFPFSRSTVPATIPSGDHGNALAYNVVQATVPAGFFSTVPLGLSRGRSFGDHEGPGDRVAVVSESAARRFWPDRDPLGQRLEVPAEASGGGVGENGVSATVVGVVRDTRVYDPWSGDCAVVYLPGEPSMIAPPFLLIRTNGPVVDCLAALKEVGRDVTGIAPRIVTVDDLFANAYLQYRVLAWVAGILASLSLIVAVIGLFGVMSFTVNQRIKEIGIRIALGATPGRVASRIVWESLRLVSVGAALGYGLSLLITMIARTFLFGVSAFDPLAGGAVVLILAAIGVFACWLPARRAANVDPVETLRAE